MNHAATTQPPRRHDSLLHKSNRQIQTPIYRVQANKHYLRPTTTTWSPLDFASFMTSSPTEIDHVETPSQKWIVNANKVLPSPPYSAHKPPLSVLPTRSSSLTNPVIKLTHSTSRPLPSLPSFNEKSTLINTPTCNDDDTSTYNAACDTDDIPMENIAKVDNDIETAMLHWKRASTLTLSKSVVHAPNSAIEEKENYNSFFTEDKELWSSASIFGDIEAILKKPSMQENCQHTADQLWNDDETVVPVKEVAAYLGKSKLFNHTVLQLYFEKFDFTLQHLEQAFRCVCGKLYFKAEAQEIDRILQAFAYRYWCCNKQSKLLYNADIVYAVVYSLLLLNTDLHIVQGLGHHRMSRSEFCENTMATITNSIFLGEQHNKLTWEHDMESYLKETYTSVKFQGILQPSSVKTNEPTIAKESSGVATTTKSLLQRMGSKKQSSPSSHRRKVNVDPCSGTNTNVETADFLRTKQDHGPGLEGRVRYRTNNNQLGRRPTKSSSSTSSSSTTSTGWHEVWLVMHHHCGSLRLEKHHNTSSRLIRQANQASSWELDLGQSTATREPPTHHHSYSTTTFHLVLGNGTWYEFECEDQDTVTTWIHHIQFVAAMTTQIPFMKPPISSDLYGWELDLTEQYDRLDSCTISTWEPPTVSDTPQMASRISSSSTTSTTSTCSTTSSSLLTTPLLASYPSNYYSKTTIMNQQKGIQQYLVTLGEELQQHSTFFTSISKIPTIYHTQKALIVTNWHEKNNYLIQQMDKYELYSKALETSLSSNNSQSISLTSLLDIDNPIHSFDLFDEINHSLKYVSLE